MYWTLAGAIVFEVFATLSLRASEGFRKKAWIAPIVLGYLASFYLLWLTLALGMPVGTPTACGPRAAWRWSRSSRASCSPNH